MPLESGKRIHANKWVQLPISDNIIHEVHQLAEIEGSNHNQDESIYIKYDSLHAKPISINDIPDMRDVLHDELQDIDDRVQLVIDHLDQMDEEDDTEYSSEMTSAGDDSTYIPSDDLTDESSFSNDPLDQSQPTEINSEDFSFNIANVYSSETNQEHTTQTNTVIEDGDVNGMEETTSEVS